MLLAAVDAGTLLQVIWVALVAGVAVTTLFSLTILAGARSAEARRDGSRGGAVAYGALAGLFFLGFAGVVAFGVQIMLTK